MPAEASTAPPDLAARLAVGLAHAMRRAGVSVPVSSAEACARAFDLVGSATRDDLYWAGRACLVNAVDQIAIYDEVFSHLVDRRPAERDGPPPPSPPERDVPGSSGAAESRRPAGARDSVVAAYSAAEALRHKDFADCTDDELREAYAAIERFRVGPTRVSRRRVPGTRGRPDLQRTARRATRTGGEAVTLLRQRRSRRPRKLVLLCDVSGSMAPYARGLIRFGQAAVASHRPVEVYAMATRLTRLTAQLATRDPDVAMRRAAIEVSDWSSGTRLGDALRSFCDERGVAGAARGATVVILSDGWDRGDPALISEQMGRLARVAHKVIWVNPLKASPGYSPEAGGMAAALPHVDEFVAGHSLEALAQLAELVSA